MRFSDLPVETGIVILAPLDALPWVREYQMVMDGPTVRPSMPGYRLVAYSTVRRRRDGGPYIRRIWFTKRADPAVYGTHDWPIEAVVPTSIAPGRPSRSKGMPSHRREVA